jgi:hAT family C-terminal dimerisation region
MQIIFDILLIPAISSEIERVFSGIKLTILPTRNRLGEDIIKATEYLNR